MTGAAGLSGGQLCACQGAYPDTAGNGAEKSYGELISVCITDDAGRKKEEKNEEEIVCSD